VEIDTDHFRGNAPGSAMLESADVTGRFDSDKVDWQALVAESPLQPHSWHHFQSNSKSPATHVRLNIYPDGGVARLRLFGRAV
jgi:allantoicase